MTVISGAVTELTLLSIWSFTMWWFSNWKSIFTLVRIQRLVCVSTGIFAFRIDMEPLTRVCTPACGQPNGGRAGAPSGYTLVLSTSIHYSKISFCRNLRNMSVYHISDSTAISLWQVRWANKWQLIDLLLDISQEPEHADTVHESIAIELIG